jgi:hypothetical protein
LIACGHDDEARSAKARPRLHFCDYGMTIFFGIGGDSERIRTRGWSGTEKSFTWMDAPKASLTIVVPSDRYDVRLQFRAGALIRLPDLPLQRAEIFVNAEKLRTWNVGEEGVYEVVVPARLLRPPKHLSIKPDFIPEPGFVIDVDVLVPGATSPNALGNGNDSRILGLRVRELRITKAQPTEGRGT